MKFRIIHPQTEEEWQKYYLLRWEILRKPWNQPKVLEAVEGDDEAVHFLALNNNNEAIGVCRLQFNSEKEAQVRFVATSESARGKGIGKQLMISAENYAKENGAEKMILHARENAVPFYQSISYKQVEKSYILFEEIQHYLMGKELSRV